MNYLENLKQYTGTDLEHLFFRPMLSGASAEELGVRVLYNMPVPTVVHLWGDKRNVLQKFTSAGWTGGSAAQKQPKTIDMQRVKAELGFSAADYFAQVYEKISARSDVNMGDLTGTDLEKAETELFRATIAENIRATMWAGDQSGSGLNTFDGFLTKVKKLITAKKITPTTYSPLLESDLGAVVALFDQLWLGADARLRDLKAGGQLAFFVTSDVYFAYEKYLDAIGSDSAYVDAVSGRAGLAYHGIPVIDICMNGYQSELPYTSCCMLTDRRNLVLAVNTADAPGNEVRMWYNPDQMENRQRAVFMAGCEILDEGLVAFANVG